MTRRTRKTWEEGHTLTTMECMEYGHSMTRHDGRGRRLDFPSVCKRRGSLTPAHPWVSPSLPPLLDLIMHDGQPSGPLLCQPTSHENLRDTTSTAPPPVMNEDDAPPEGRSDDRPATPPKPSHNEAQKKIRITASYYGSSARLEVPHRVWVGVTVLSLLNMFHSDFLLVFF